MSDIVNKLWGFCHTLRHDGINHSYYIEQITYLLFLKMADERGVELPPKCDWATLRDGSGTDLKDAFTDMLRTLGKRPGLLGDIFTEAQNRFTKPVSLKQLVNLIDETDWTATDKDIKAEAYEGLLDRAAAEGKKGAGQFFTPRPLIQAIVRCVKPDPRTHNGYTVCDPACGTGGFLVAAYEWFNKLTGGAMDRDLSKRVRKSTYFGQDIDAQPRRLALMNLFLHNVDASIALGDTIYDPPGRRDFDAILTNPPFGTRGANQAPDRDDFTVSTSNKQLNFLQHVMTVLRTGGRAAVVLPDNCLFADQAGEVFKILCDDCDLHTVLRLPRGTFTPYSQGVKANVVFFTKGAPSETVWIYDARTNVPGITKKDRPLMPAHFADFEACFGDPWRPGGVRKRKAAERWQAFEIGEVRKREFKLDGFKWLKEESAEDADELPDPEDLAAEAMAELKDVFGELEQVLKLLGAGG